MGEHVVLVGMMGSGKSTVAPKVARLLGRPHFDVDEEVERRLGRSVAQVFEDLGEDAFRREEARALTDLVSHERSSVISVGGGAVLDPSNREVLRHAGMVVWLRARVETLAGRVGDGSDRPLLGSRPGSTLARLERDRRELYGSVSDVAVDVDDLDPDAVAERVLGFVSQRSFTPSHREEFRG